MSHRIIPFLALALLAGCGRSDDGGGVTQGEQKALDDAAAMIETQQLNPSAIPSAPAPAAVPLPAAAPSASAQSN